MESPNKIHAGCSRQWIEHASQHDGLHAQNPIAGTVYPAAAEISAEALSQ